MTSIMISFGQNYDSKFLELSLLKILEKFLNSSLNYMYYFLSKNQKRGGIMLNEESTWSGLIFRMI